MTIVEGLKLGCKVVGVDLNPVAWFVTKKEVDPVDLEALQREFERFVLGIRKMGSGGVGENAAEQSMVVRK